MNIAQKTTITFIFVGAALLIGHELKLYLPDLEKWIESLGVFAPFAYALLFIVCAPLFVSIDALCFTAGVLFPLLTGELIIIIATYTSSALIFFLGRDLFRIKVLNFIAKHNRFAVLNTIMGSNNAFKLTFLLRLTPLPFAMLSYALSVTEIKFWPYLTATTGILIYNGSLVYLGYATKHLTNLAANGTVHVGSASYSVIIAGVLVLLLVLYYIAKIAGNALKQLQINQFKD